LRRIGHWHLVIGHSFVIRTSSFGFFCLVAQFYPLTPDVK
jgi:hypothetical protein